MIRLLIIADDFTGALDTGVQSATVGAITRVVTDISYDYQQADEMVRVLVMDAETRHLSKIEAYHIVYEIVRRAVEYGIPYIYKKTDSALRGNIGSELTALLEASGEKVLPFLPAFPKMGRTTREGIHYIDGITVHQSVFGSDPFEPVTCSYVPDIIHQQSRVPVAVVKAGQEPELMTEPLIEVYDVQNDEEIKEIGRNLKDKNKLRIMAGCAGFATVLPKLLELKGEKSGSPMFTPGFLVVCGSINPFTKRQLDYGEQHAFTRIRLTPEQKLDTDYWKSAKGNQILKQWVENCSMKMRCILDTNDYPESSETMEYAHARGITLKEVRIRIASTLGYLIQKLIAGGVRSTIMITGGDTLLGFMSQMQVYEMEPLCELEPGIVLSKFRIEGETYQIISKSGGFGKDDLLVKLAETIEEKKESI